MNLGELAVACHSTAQHDLVARTTSAHQYCLEEVYSLLVKHQSACPDDGGCIVHDHAGLLTTESCCWQHTHRLAATSELLLQQLLTIG